MYDVTEQKRAERELAQALDMRRKAVERLREADDMKNTFLTAVSHDLRTPLSAILGSAITLESADELGISKVAVSWSEPCPQVPSPDGHGQRPPRDGPPHSRPRPAAARADGLGALLGRTVAESDVLEERTVHVQTEPIDAGSTSRWS